MKDDNLDDWLQEGLDEYKSKTETTDFGYDAVKTTKRRAAPTRVVKSEDKHLKETDRKILVSTTRDIRRNFITPRWAIAKHIDFVADMSFNPNTGDKDFDKTLAEFVREASKPEHFDVAGRHGLDRFVRLAESARIIDGDFMAIRVRGGYLQAIESDRIRNPSIADQGLIHTDGVNEDDWVHGVKSNKYGRPMKYAIHNRQQTSFVYEGSISARKVITHGFYDRFDQVRGVSPMASAINSLKDLHESYDYALAKAKVAQLFSLAITREAEFGMGSEFDDGDISDDRTIKFGKDPQVLDLNVGEDAKFLSTNTPEADTQAFWENMTSLVLKSLNLPYCFWQENHTNFFGSRAALILYLRSVNKWREDVIAFRNDWLCWRLKVGMLKGEIVMPEWFECEPHNWDWIPEGLAYWNPAQEVKADVEAVNNGLRTRTEIRRERYGDDWAQVAEKLAAENELMANLGITPVDQIIPEIQPENKDSNNE